MNFRTLLVGPVAAIVIVLAPAAASAQPTPGISRPLIMCPGQTQEGACLNDAWTTAQRLAANGAMYIGAPPAVPPPPPPRPSAAEQARLDAACVAACPSDAPTCPCACRRMNPGPGGTCLSTASGFATVFAITDNLSRRMETLERRAGIEVGTLPGVIVVTRPRRPAVAPAAAPRVPRPHRERHHRHH